MAYATGSATNLNDLYDALVTFMTANGWTLHDTVTTRDKVLKSNGTDGKRNMTYRLTAYNEAGNPYKGVSDYHKFAANILVRGYHNWDAPTNTGLNEFGKLGPWILQGEQWSNTGSYCFLRFDVSPPPANGSISFHHAMGSTGNMVNHFDGRRKAWSFSTTSQSLRVLDIATGEAFAATSNGSLVQNFGNRYALVYDVATDKEYIYVLNNTSTQIDQFWRYDVDANSWGRLASPNVSGTPQGGWVIWNGGDFLYVLMGGNGVGFQRYQISTNTWTVLTNAPAGRSTNLTPFNGSSTSINCVYVPASVTGFSEDVIYTMLASSGSTIYRYDVTSNVWRSTTGTGALSSPTTLDNQILLLFDGQRYLYYGDINADDNGWYRSDLTTTPNTFVNIGTLMDTPRPTGGAIFINHNTSHIRGHETAFVQYFFYGDADRVVVVTRIGTNILNGKYYWAYMGKYDTYYRPNVMTMTAGASAGSLVSIQVDSNAGYVAGDSVQVWDPTTGNIELTNIFDMPNGTTIRCGITKSYTIGSRVGVDVSQQIITGDTGWGCTPIDAKGYKTDNEIPAYLVEPALGVSANLRGAPTIRNYFMPVPYHIYHPYSNLSRYETLGTLKGVFAINKGAYPKPQPEDVIFVGAQQYKYFPVRETERWGSDNRGIIIGPIN